ncbi:MAG: family 16 glycoside hydrolase, partial [Planctomycetota bacterium]
MDDLRLAARANLAKCAACATCVAFATTPLLAVSAASPDEAAPLFDGVSLQGWSGDDRFWSVEDGAIVGRSTAQTPCERNTYLIREGEFDDFELRLEFAIDGGNSGIQYRSRDLGDFAVAGYQADLEAGPNYTGILYEEKGRGIVAWRGERARIGADGSKTASPDLGDRAALQSAIKPGWNEYVIRAVGPTLTHTINGVPMVEVVDLAPQAAARGRIALQLHAGPPMTVRYRNISLQPLEVDDLDDAGGPSAAPPSPPPLEPSLEAGDVAWIWGSNPAGEAGDVAWIWGSNPAGENDRFWLRTTFELDEPATLEELIATCDNRFSLALDGAEILSGRNWERPQVRRNVATLEAGSHELLVRAENDGGPAGLLLRATLRFADGRERIIRTDDSWQAADVVADDDDPQTWRPADGWRPAHSFGPSGAPNGPWPDPLAPRVATPAESITVPPGYRVEQGSWISLAFDDRGDLLVGREGLPIARVDLPRRGGGGVEVVDVPGSPLTSMGFASAHGALYAQGRGDEGYGLFRVRDTDGDGVYDFSERLADLGGGGEHGAHAVVPAPDGSILLMNGNMSRLPGELAATSPHARWAEDVLLERIEDPRGHAVGLKAPGGHVLRTDKDATSFEIVAAGFRNAYDLAISPDGDLFTFDSDMEWDLGLPWYRPTRVHHVVPGSDHGWRSGNAKWRDGTPEMLPPVVDIGMSSPV